MRADEIITQLRLFMPFFSDSFGDTITADSITVSGNVATVTTALDHGMLAGQYVTISGAKSPVAVASITHIDGAATLTTAVSHDITKSDAENYEPSFTVYGADQTDYNGTFSVSASSQLPNRTTVGYTVPSTAVTPATGAIVLDDGKDRGYNGRHQILSVPSTTTFTYTISSLSLPTVAAQGTIKIAKCVRVSGAVSEGAALRAYTAQADGNYWAFVILQNTSVSRDRNITSDATQTKTDNDEFRARVIFTFKVLVFAPCKDEQAGRAVRDEMNSTIFSAMVKSLVGFKASSPFCEDAFSRVILTQHGFVEYLDAYYVHEYEFEQVSDMSYNDTLEQNTDIAFRDICNNMNIQSGNENIDITFGSNLDDTI